MAKLQKYRRFSSNLPNNAKKISGLPKTIKFIYGIFIATACFGMFVFVANIIDYHGKNVPVNNNAGANMKARLHALYRMVIPHGPFLPHVIARTELGAKTRSRMTQKQIEQSFGSPGMIQTGSNSTQYLYFYPLDTAEKNISKGNGIGVKFMFDSTGRLISESILDAGFYALADIPDEKLRKMLPAGTLMTEVKQIMGEPVRVIQTDNTNRNNVLYVYRVKSSANHVEILVIFNDAKVVGVKRLQVPLPQDNTIEMEL